MDRPRRGIAAELIAVTLIAGCLAGALAVVIAVHRRQPPRRPTAPAVALLPAVPEIAAKPAPVSIPAPPAPATPPPVDATPRLLAELATAEAEQRAEADKAFQRIATLEAATRAARAESDRGKRAQAVARTQIGTREAEARTIEGKAEMSVFERDALARRRDTLKQALEQDRNRPSYAVLPHRGPNGTWQRPIVLECDAEGVHVRPNGPSFDVTDIASAFGLRGNAFLMAITREALRIQRGQGPDGADVTPYIFFIVRPGGIRAYYESRTRLERLGIAFGYELADAEWKIDFPDLDQPETWDGSPPSHPDATAAIDTLTPRGTGGRPSRAEIDDAFRWPKTTSGVEGRGNSLGAVSLPNSDRGGSGDGLGGAEGEAPGVAGSGSSGTQTFPRGGFGGGGSDGEPVQGDWSDSWDRALRRGGPSRLIGRVPWARGDTGLRTTADATGGLDVPASRGGSRPIDPTAGVPGGQTAWEAATAAGSLPATGGGGDPTSDPGGMPTGSQGLRQIPGPMPPLPSRSGGDPAPSADDGEVTGRAGQTDSSGAGSSGLARGGSPSASRGPGRASGGENSSPGDASSGTLPPPSQGQGQAGGGENSSPGDPRAGTPPAPGLGQGQAGGGENSSSDGRTRQSRDGGGQNGGQGSSGGQGSNGSAGQAGSRGSQSSAGESGGQGGAPSVFGPTGRASRPFELVLACGPKGVAVQPGDYRVTKTTLGSKETLLVAQLRAIVKEEETLHPGRPLRPMIRYLIQSGGHETYTIARGQLDFSDLGWPCSVRIAGGDAPRLFSTDDW